MDAFSILGLPRKLVIRAEDLERELREASRSAHPDAGGADVDFGIVRKAGETLKSPVARLRLALELSGGDLNSRGQLNSEVMDYFSPIAGVIQKTEQLVGERERALSGLGKAVIDARIPGVKRELEEMMGKLAELEERLVGRFEIFDEQGWERSLDEMAETGRALAFVVKWQAQLRAATGKLFEALLGG